MTRRLTIAACALLVVVLALASQPVAADGAWLDGPPSQWNTPGMAIPQSPHRPPQGDQRCFDALVVPDTAAKRALVEAGWFLFNAPPRPMPGPEILNGQSGADGMCRPIGYQTFVFVGGVFAGTLSPVLMNSRDEGALVQTSIVSDTQIQAEYVRYTNQDPLCCPSARSTATFAIVRDGAGPVVRLVSVSTQPTGAPTMVPSPVMPPVQLPRGQ
jgi:hypothetical protein